jgi:hypothetical protein
VAGEVHQQRYAAAAVAVVVVRFDALSFSMPIAPQTIYILQ